MRTILSIAYSFITGLIVGMPIIQTFFNRLSESLSEDKAPETSTPPREIMSYAIQANRALAWRDIILMTALFLLGALQTRLAPCLVNDV